jgi:3-oxoadipate enol-lactonase
VNGLFATQASWDQALPFLTPHFRVVTYDGRGQHPEFRPAGPYTLAQHVDDLSLVVGKLESLGVKTSQEQVCVLGLSNGGRTALEYARRYSSQVKALVVADTYAEVSPALKLKIQSWQKASDLGGPAHRFDIATPWVWGESFLRQNAAVVNAYRERADFFNQEITRALLNGALDGPIVLNEIQCPTLIMVGEEDVLTPLRGHLEMMKELKQAKIEIIRGGHASLIEYPQTIEQVVLPFFKEEVL